MKITFLGTSHGVPAADRYCACTMIEAGGAVYFIDAGAPLMDILLRRGVDLEKIRAVFTTHLHGDHVNGILAFADLINWYFRTVRTQIYLTEEAGISAFKQLIRATEGKALDEERVAFRLAQPGLVYADENIRVTALPTRHMAGENRPSYAYLVEAEGKKALFTGDLSHHLALEDFPDYALKQHVDLLVMEMAHFGVEQAVPYLARCQTGRLEVQHVYPLEKLEAIRALDGVYGYPVHTPADGDSIEL